MGDGDELSDISPQVDLTQTSLGLLAAGAQRQWPGHLRGYTALPIAGAHLMLVSVISI